MNEHRALQIFTASVLLKGAHALIEVVALFDMIVMILIWHEYGLIRRHVRLD